jgi:hypothetical protein
MSVAAPRHSVGTRRLGYLVGAAVNAILLYLVNVEPTWTALPFLTGDTPQVLALVNAALLMSLLANLVYAADDAPWIKALGDLLTTAVGLAAAVRIWQVFPFSFDDSGFPWEQLTRVLLVVAIVGSVIGIIVNLVSLARGVSGLLR